MLLLPGGLDVFYIDESHDTKLYAVTAVTGQRGTLLYGEERLSRVMNALFQRMRTQCVARRVNAMVFFDEGHPEYRSLYRKAQKVLLTGSKMGGGTRNLPLDMFVKDGNEKKSEHCHFTQIADLVAYAAFSRVKQERGIADDNGQLSTMYSGLPLNLINTKVASGNPPDGIVRLQ